MFNILIQHYVNFDKIGKYYTWQKLFRVHSSRFQELVYTDYPEYLYGSSLLLHVVGFQLGLMVPCPSSVIENVNIHWRIQLQYYLFKKFLVSDWLTANCEIVISTQWLTKYGFFTFILAK
jgi:hypothetical protein